MGGTVALFVVGLLIVLFYAEESGASIMQTINKTTWPSGDPIWDIARAIAQQEGFGISSSAPTRNHNPGDISDGANTYGYDHSVTSSRVTTFPDDTTGWQWLYDKLSKIYAGNSSAYDPSVPWSGWCGPDAQTGPWAADPNWGDGVASNLGVDSSTSMNDYLASKGW